MQFKVSSFLPSYEGLPRTFWILLAGMLINRLGGFVAPFLAFYLTQERQLPSENIGLIIAAYGVGLTISGPLGGKLSDHWGRRATMVLGLLLGAAALLHLGFAHATWHISLGTFLFGLFGEMYRPAASAAIADIVEPERRTQAYGFLYWVINLGFAIGASLAGFLVHFGYLTLFVGDAATTLIFGLIIWAVIPETKPSESTLARQQDKQDHLTPLRNRRLLSFMLIVFVLNAIYIQDVVTLPLDIEHHGIPAHFFGLLCALNGVLVVVFQPLVTNLVEQRSPMMAIAFAALLIGCGFGLTGLATSVPMYALSITIWTFGELVMSPVAPAVVANLAPPKQQGSYQGMYQLSIGVAICLGPVTGSYVFGTFGPSALWFGCLGLGVIVAVVTFFLAPLWNPK